MATFKYKAVTHDGAPVDGFVTAYDEFEAIDQIKQSYAFVSSIEEIRGEDGLNKNIFGTPPISDKALSLLCSQFAIILKAGLPVARAVQLIAQQTSDKRLKKILTEVGEDVSSGYSLAQSLESKGRDLPTTMIETIRSGEESGTLEIAFAKLEVYFGKSAKIKASVRSAMMYPIFLCIIAAIVIGIVLTVAMPTFAQMFASMDSELPALTQGLIAFSAYMQGNILWYVFGILAIFLVYRLYARTESGRINLARLHLKLPALGNVALMKGSSQFANTMATMITAGLPIIRAINVTAKVVDNAYLGVQLGACAKGLEEGRGLGECLRQTGCFPDLLVEMAAVGDETGSLESTLETISVYYDHEVEVASTRALSVLQPAITLIMGVVIGIIVIALYLPMFTMYGSM